jgi:hypothetical protein
MDLAKVLAQLHMELQNLDAAIASLERIQQGGPRRGRPPEWLNKTRTAGARGKPVGPGKEETD